MNLDWIDEFLPSLEGIALKGAKEEGITLKQWVTIHGHPVNIGGGGGGGGKPGTSGPAGTATDGRMKPGPSPFPASTHASPGASQTNWSHGLVDTPTQKGVHVRFTTHSQYLGGEHDRIAYEGPGGVSGNTKIEKANLRPARAYTPEEHQEVDYGIGKRNAAASVYQAGYSAPANASQAPKKPTYAPGRKPFSTPAVAGDINSPEMRPRAADMKPLKPEPKHVDSAAKPVKHRKPAGSF